METAKERDLYGTINWTKVCNLSKKIRRFLEKNHRGYNVFEILMAFELVKHTGIPEDLLNKERSGFSN